MGEKKLNTNNIQFRSVQLQNLCFKQCYNKKLSYRRETARQSAAHVFLGWLIDRA